MINQDNCLLNLFAAINRQSTEADIEKYIIIPLLQLLGYRNTDWREQVSFGRNRFDFLVHPPELLKHPPYLVIEAKAPNRQIFYNSWQINQYMRKSGAVLGLLTNGYHFRILYHYENQIETIAEYSQPELIANFKLVYSLFSKESCLKFAYALSYMQDKVNHRFINIISKAFQNEAILGLFKKKQNINFATNNPLINSEEDSLTSQKRKGEGMIITVFNNKGGVGKTTMTINLAAAINQLGKRVLLIDIDAQANLTTGLGIDPLDDIELQGKKDVTHLLTEPKTKLEDTIFCKKWPHIGVELDIIPSHIRLSQMESELIQIFDSDRLLLKKLKNHNYDFIFIDPPPSFGKVNRISLMASSGILIPTQLSPYPVRALEYVLEQAYQIQEVREGDLPILGIAVSMYDERSSTFNGSMVDRIYEILKKNPEGKEIKLFNENTWIPRLNIVAKCPDKGYPLHQVEFDSSMPSADKQSAEKAIDRYQQLAKQLINNINQGE